ncbi:MAG TPA: ATP-binding protein [Gaiellaceae bacterium]|nr:ATP-binding protein [Gaiellaceae bacterium]
MPKSQAASLGRLRDVPGAAGTSWEPVVGAIAIAGAVVAFAITVRADFLAHPGWLAVQKADFILGPIGVGLYWHHRRPHNRLGLLLIAYGLVSIPYVLESISWPWLFTSGTMAEAAMIPLSITLVLAFPSGRLDGLPERSIIAGALVGYTLPYLVWLLASPDQLIPRLSLSGCRGVCPHNPFAIWSTPSWYPASVEFLRAALICVDVSAVLLVLSRFVNATPPRRRALAIGAPIALVYLIAQIVYQTNQVIDRHYAQPTVQNLTGPYQWTIAGARALPWYGFLFALIAAELYAGRVLRTVVRDASRHPSLGDLEGMLRRPLGDPGLRLGFRSPTTGGWVDADGGVLAPGADQRLTEFERAPGQAVAIVHDVQLAEDPELLETAAEIALLALENAELESAWKDSLRDLSDSRARIVQAGDRERRKLELDLHDGAQQRLLAVQMKLALARERTRDQELAAKLDEIGGDAASAVDDLRKLAHGIYPSELREGGVGAGLRSYVGSAPVPIEVVDRGFGRCDPEVEACIYFCALEAVQNAVKHAGRDIRVEIVLRREGPTARFAVHDDGVGFDPEAERDGLGLVSMRDRLAALGGELAISSVPGEGTTVRGAVPVAVSQVEALT